MLVRAYHIGRVMLQARGLSFGGVLLIEDLPDAPGGGVGVGDEGVVLVVAVGQAGVEEEAGVFGVLLEKASLVGLRRHIPCNIPSEAGNMSGYCLRCLQNGGTVALGHLSQKITRASLGLFPGKKGLPPPPAPNDDLDALWSHLSSLPAEQQGIEMEYTLERYLRTLLPDTLVALDGMDQVCLRQMGEALLRVYADFPDALRFLKLIGASDTYEARFVSSTPLPGQVYAQYVPDERALLLNHWWFSHSARFLQQLALEERQGFHPAGCASIRAAVIHELGHLLWQWLRRRHRTRKALKHWIGQPVAHEGVSRYGVASHEERWAEGFAAFYEGSPPSQEHPYVQAQRAFLRHFAHLPASAPGD